MFHFLRLTLALGTIFILASCGPVSFSEEQPAASSAVAPTLLSDDWPQATWVTPSPLVLPLSEYAAFFDGPAPDPAQQQQQADWARQVEDDKSKCMKDAGFTYFPFDAVIPSDSGQSQWSQLLSTLPVPYLSTDSAIVDKYGYGLMPTPEQQSQLDGTQPEDQNVQYIASLSAQAAQAYDIALYGDSSQEGTGRANGCAGAALAKYPEPAEPLVQQQFQETFGDLLRAVNSDVRLDWVGDSRVADLNQEWYDCMAGLGFGTWPDSTRLGPTDALDLAIRTRPDGTLGSWGADTPTSEIPDVEKSLVGNAAERKVASADFTCRTSTNYLQRAADIRVSRDQEFIDQYSVELTQLQAAVSAER